MDTVRLIDKLCIEIDEMCHYDSAKCTYGARDILRVLIDNGVVSKQEILEALPNSKFCNSRVADML